MATETPENVKLDFTTFHNIIDGKLEKGTTTGHTVNPSTEEANPEFPISTEDDVNRAVKVAQGAAKEWAKVPWAERQKALANFAAALEARTAEFVELMAWEHGKPPIWASSEMVTALAFLKGFATSISLPEETVEDDPRWEKVTTRYLPLGVAVGIVSWNYPMFLICGKIGPALISGNAFILKPSEFTPYSGLKIVELANQFFPPGVIQVLSGDESLGPLLTSHPDVNMVSFTGSAPAGKAVMRSCSNTLKRVTLELGGNDPAIVCADVDLATAMGKVITFALVNTGQLCIGIKRVYVHESIYDQFLGATLAYIDSLQLGIGETAFIGPVANETHYKRLQKLLASIQDEGLTIATGGVQSLPDRKGFYLPPTVIDNPPDSAQIVQEEQFAPIIPIMKWSDEDDVIQRANGTKTGLGASVWSRDLVQAERIARQIDSGSVWINAHAEIFPNYPFSGHKESGIVGEYGLDGVKAFCDTQVVYHRKF